MTTALPRLFCWKSSWSSLSSSSFLSSPSSSSNDASNNSKNSIWSNTTHRTTCICRHRYHRAVNDCIGTWTIIAFSTHTTCSCLSSNADSCSTLEKQRFCYYCYLSISIVTITITIVVVGVVVVLETVAMVVAAHIIWHFRRNIMQGGGVTALECERGTTFHLWTITKLFKWLCRRKIMEGEIKDSNNVSTSC